MRSILMVIHPNNYLWDMVIVLKTNEGVRLVLFSNELFELLRSIMNGMPK